MLIPENRVTRIIVMLVFLFCMLFANFYAVRKINLYGIKLYFYDKLLVAYNIGGREGIDKELKEIFASDKFPRELALARDFQTQLGGLKDPATFLNQRSVQSKEKIMLLRNLRSAAIILMLFIFGWRILFNFLQRRRA